MKNFFIFSLSFLLFSSSLKAALTQEQKDIEKKILLDFVTCCTNHGEYFIKNTERSNNPYYVKYTTGKLKELKIFDNPNLQDAYAYSEVHVTINDSGDNESIAQEVKEFMQFLFPFTHNNMLKLDLFGPKVFYKGSLASVKKYLGIKLDPSTSYSRSYHISIFDYQKIVELNGNSLPETLKLETKEITRYITDVNSKKIFADALKHEFFQKFGLFFISQMNKDLNEIVKDLELKFSVPTLSSNRFLMTGIESQEKEENRLLANFDGNKKFFMKIFNIIDYINDKGLELITEKENEELIKSYIDTLTNFIDVFFDILPENILNKNQDDNLYSFSKLMKKVKENAQKFSESIRLKNDEQEEMLIKQQEEEKTEEEKTEEGQGSKLLEEANKTISSAKVVKLNKKAKAFKPRNPKPNDSQ